MTTWYVATLARYVLVEAEDEASARELGQAALHEMDTEIHERLGRDVPITIVTVRPATEGEIGLQRWHDEVVAREAGLRRACTRRGLL
jgi:hypothetical protein